MMDNKKQAKIIVALVVAAWIIVIIGIIVFNIVKDRNTDEKGSIVIKQASSAEASSHYYDPFKNSNIDSSSYLADNVYVIDNEDLLTNDFMTTKGRFYLSTAVSDYLNKNNYDGVEYITVMPESLYTDMNYATFAAKLGDTDEYIQITVDKITSYFSIKNLPSYAKDTSYEYSVELVNYYIDKYVYKNE